MKKLIGLLAFTVLFVLSTNAQNFFDIRLNTQSINCETNEVCYDVQIKSGTERLWRFAGQNYRLFYNGNLAEFSKVEGRLNGPYTEPEVVQNIQHLDLSAEGNLSFDEDISWLNYYIDMNTALEGNIISPDVWTTTSTICFTADVDLMNNPSKCFEMVWAREDLTFNYATAFVEVSEWVAPNSTNDHVHGMTYHDLNVANSDEACFSLTCAGNPPLYDSKIVLKSTDTITNISCYAIQIKSSNARIWTLGDRKYTLLFDGSQASFQSIESSLTGSGTATMGDLLENLTFSGGSGNVTFENDLSAVSFSIDQDTDEVSLGGEYVEVAEICLDFSGSIGSAECFEMVFGRAGLTDEYYSSYTDIFNSDDGMKATSVNFIDYNKCTSVPCPNLSAPVSNGDIRICEGDMLPALSVQEETGYVVRWYKTPIGGVPVAMGISYQPDAAGIFYAETFDESQNCFSNSRTPVALLDTPIPTLNILSKACLNDQSSYTLRFTTDVNNVVANQGTLQKLVGLEWMVSGIPSGIDVQVTLINNVTLCKRIEDIVAPNCECQLVSAPISQGSKVACEGDTYPSLSVQLVQENMTADWYTRIDGGTPLVTDQTEYTPNNISCTGLYTYYVQARSLDNGCTSTMRTEIALTVVEAPIYAFVGTSCAEDMQSYMATFYSDATMVQTNIGTLSEDGNGVWRVTNIPIDSNAELQLTSPAGCILIKEITASVCECDNVEAPICRGRITTCEGIDYEGFLAFVPNGHEIRWYDSEIAGTLLATGDVFKPSLAGKYYAETENISSGCVSQERAEVELIISPVPNLQVVNKVLCRGDTIVWTELVKDLNNTEGSSAVFANFRDAINNENAITETSLIINELGSYFFRKTSDAGCYDIEVIIVIPENCGSSCLVNAGKYEVSGDICFDGIQATLRGVEVTQPTIPTGYLHGFIFSSGSEKVFFNIDDVPEIVVDSIGEYRMHSIVFDPNDMSFEFIPDAITTIDELVDYLDQPELKVCYAIDAEGLLFDVEICSDVCQAFAGRPTAGNIECLGVSPVALSVEMNPLDVIIPEGFVQIFILTTGAELIIMGAQSEVFVVNNPGEYKVHSLVFDPLTLDLGLVEPGVTTAFDIFNLLMEGGGDICASFDMNGALFNVELCVLECTADAGRTIAIADLCVDDTPIQFSPGNVDAIIPDGFTLTFIHTTGDDFIIRDIKKESFTVDTAGDYRIHSLVYDPLTIDFSGVVFGETTISQIMNGDICASFDTEGAVFSIEKCVKECTAFAGNTVAGNFSCFDGNPQVLDVSVTDDIIVPLGFIKSFIITKGSDFIVIGIQSEPFSISAPGKYKVNSFIYDPNTFVMNTVVLGTTSFFDISNMFVANGGDLCGSIDFFGASFEIKDCEEECEVVLGEVTYSIPECFDTLSSISNQIIAVALGGTEMLFEDGFEIISLISQNGIVIDYNGAEFIPIEAERALSVHPMLSNPSEFSTSNIILGVTSISSIVAQFATGGGDICGAIDSSGTPFIFEICMDDEEIDLELDKQINNINPNSGEEVTFTIEIFNNSANMATGVAVADRLPSGYALSGNISDSGISEEGDNETEILWTGLSIAPMTTRRVTFTAIVNAGGADTDYKNIAEVAGADQHDKDSTPNNDDGDQSEDDEDNVVPNVGVSSIDLELVKISNISSAQPGQELVYNINISNRSMTMATGIAIEDIIPIGLDLATVSNISSGGELVGNKIVWTGLEIGLLSSMNVTYSASISSDAMAGNFKNVAQITAADQSDLDSSPNNDDGDQSEDDEDSAIVNVAAPFIDLSLTKEVNNLTPTPGEMIIFEITVNNNGTIPATGISVTDILPMSGYDLESISNVQPVAQVVDNVLIWTINEIMPDDEVTLSFDIMVTPDGGDYKNIAQVTSANEPDSDSTPNNDDGDQSEDDEDNAMVTVILSNEIIDIEVQKDVSELVPKIGDVIIYEVLVVNNGPFDATNVKVQDVTPDGIDAMDITGPNSQENGVITWTIPLLKVGENMVFEYSSIVFESLTGDYTNVVQVIAADQDDIDSTPANDDGDQSEDDEASATIFPMIMAEVDLELDKSVDNKCAQPSDRVTFTIDVFNNSDVIATGVSVEDVLSNGFTLIQDISNGGSITGLVVTWSGLSLLPRETLSLSYTAAISHNGNPLVNTAQIISIDQTDTDSAPANDDGDQSEDDEDKVTMSGEKIFDLELEKTVDNKFAKPGDRVRFDITVRNTGCINATGVAIRDIIPSGYKAIRNITDLGIRGGNVIIWEDISVNAGNSKTVTFTAEVVHFSINCDYINVAEILEVDQDDIDSTPGNDDGDQSEDDEDKAEVFAGFMSDLELTMTADKSEVITGDIITYTIKVCNKGPGNAINVEVRNFLPENVQVTGELNYKGQVNGNEIKWSGFTFVVGTCLEMIVQVEVLDAETTNTLINAAEIVRSDQLDPDSSPGNGKGDGAEDEDDYAEVEVTQFVALPAVISELPNMMKVTLNTALYLEGAYNALTGELYTTLNKLGYLPGQKPTSFFADATNAGQPYKSAPWNYKGKEGKIYDANADFSIKYPKDVVDWVLISLRTDKTYQSTVLFRAALLLKDGSVIMPPDVESIILDANKDYYLVVEHRNHLPIMSAIPLSVETGMLSFDFRKNESFTGLLGSGQKDVNGSYCVYAANGDQFKERLSALDINIRDMDLWNQSNGLNSAYMNADYDMNGDVNVNDQIMWLLNNGIFSDVPR